MQSIDRLLKTIEKDHKTRSPALPEELKLLEVMGMPEEILYFYSKSNGALIHRSDSKYDIPFDGSYWLWELLSASDIRSIADSGWSHADSPLHQSHRNWFQIVDVLDDNYLSVVLDGSNFGHVLDTFHETLNMVGYNQIVAKSFGELVLRMLDSRDAFWLRGDTGYGYL